MKNQGKFEEECLMSVVKMGGRFIENLKKIVTSVHAYALILKVKQKLNKKCACLSLQTNCLNLLVYVTLNGLYFRIA